MTACPPIYFRNKMSLANTVHDKNFDSLPTNLYFWKVLVWEAQAEKESQLLLSDSDALTNSASCDFVVWTTKAIHIEEDHCYSMSS